MSREDARFPVWGFLVGLCCLAGLAACATGSQSVATAPAASGASGGHGPETLLEMRCGHCHVVGTIKRYRKTPEQWERTINRMRLMGVAVSDGERAVLRDYLSVPAGQESR